MTYKPDDIDSRLKALELFNSVKIAEDSYSGFGSLKEDYNGDAVVCAASGVPVWEGDEIVEDPLTDEVFLRAAVGLPPRAITEGTAEEGEDEDAESAAA